MLCSCQTRQSDTPQSTQARPPAAAIVSSTMTPLSPTSAADRVAAPVSVIGSTELPSGTRNLEGQVAWKATNLQLTAAGQFTAIITTTDQTPRLHLMVDQLPLAKELLFVQAAFGDYYQPMGEWGYFYQTQPLPVVPRTSNATMAVFAVNLTIPLRLAAEQRAQRDVQPIIVGLTWVRQYLRNGITFYRVLPGSGTWHKTQTQTFALDQQVPRLSGLFDNTFAEQEDMLEPGSEVYRQWFQPGMLPIPTPQ
jgi:hypothetical protein